MDLHARTRLAQIAYDAYGASTQWRNYQGNPMPVWGDLGEPIQRAWIAAATTVASTVGRDLIDLAEDWLQVR